MFGIVKPLVVSLDQLLKTHTMATLKITKEIASAIKNMGTMDSLVFNFNSNILRIFNTLKKPIEIKTCLSVEFENKYPQHKGLIHVYGYELNDLVKLIKENSEIYFHIENNGTEQLKQDGYSWQFLQFNIYSGKRTYKLHLGNHISKNTEWLPINQVNNLWINEPLNQLRIY